MAKRLQSIGTDRLPVASKDSLQRRVKEPVGPPRPRVSAARPRALREAFPHHKTIELPGANHFFFEDSAQQMVQEIRVFASGETRDVPRS